MRVEKVWLNGREYGRVYWHKHRKIITYAVWERRTRNMFRGVFLGQHVY